MMQYIPELDKREIEDNHKHFNERISLYKSKGLDFIKSREFILEKAGSLSGSVLEIGAGTGYTTLFLAREGRDLTAIDADREALKKTALNLAYEDLRLKVKLYVMNAKVLAFDNSSFKNIICLNMLHHIDNADKIFLEMDRILCPDGKIILADFNKKGMGLVNSVHQQESRTHEDSGIGQDISHNYFYGLGYKVKSYEEEYHWVLIAEKEIQK